MKIFTGCARDLHAFLQLIQFNVQPSQIRFNLLFSNVKQSKQLDMLRAWRRQALHKRPSCGAELTASSRIAESTRDESAHAESFHGQSEREPYGRGSFTCEVLAAAVNAPASAAAAVTNAATHAAASLFPSSRDSSRVTTASKTVKHSPHVKRVSSDRTVASDSAGVGPSHSGIDELAYEFQFAGYDTFSRQRSEAFRRANQVWGGLASKLKSLTRKSFQVEEMPAEWIDLMMW